MNTNHQLVRGNYTAKADSMGTGQIRHSQKNLLWDQTDTMLLADGRKQEKQWPEILAEHLWAENPSEKQKQPTKFQ